VTGKGSFTARPPEENPKKIGNPDLFSALEPERPSGGRKFRSRSRDHERTLSGGRPWRYGGAAFPDTNQIRDTRTSR
jgi:hypothetical protein